ncbi:hypothetical protein D3C72_2477230 [compost metagenome]
MSSGVWSCTSEDRITTLTTSDAPTRNRAKSDTAIFFEMAKSIVASPNTPSAANSLRPTAFFSGK